MKRRAFIVGIGMGVSFGPGHGATQQPVKPARVGWITLAPIPHLAAFRDGMHALGHVENKTYVVEERYAGGDVDRLPALVHELLKTPVDVFVVAGATTLGAVVAATRSVPVVAVTGDPVGYGFAASLARPGSNVTGLSILSPELAAKWIELIKEALPALTHLAVLADDSPPSQVERVEAIGRSIGVAVTQIRATTIPEIESAFHRAVGIKAQAIVVPSSAFFGSQAPRIVALAERFRLPAIYEGRTFTTLGGLVSYGPVVAASFRRAAFYVDRILKGAHPSDLPIEQPTKFELVVNLKTAKALGIAIPESILIRADEVIE